ncbi:MAG TPA: OmpA family protein [Bryobacteraceae bacterium]|nr:OmpA family protein [Bryobacteraceae bacterium]
MRTTILLVAFACLAAAQDIPFTVELTTPISTSSNHKGDPVTAQVVQPDNFRGDTVQGHITDLKSGNKIHGESVLKFNFDTLMHGSTAVPINSSVTSMANSKKQENVDEEGHVIRKSSNIGKAAAGTGVGALVGGLTHGVKGAAIGAGVGAAASLILIEVAAEGPKIEFAPGSQFGLSVKSRGGPELASLSPNAAPTTAPPPAGGGNSTPQPVSAPATNSAAAPAPAAATEPSGGDQPQLSSLKIDFVPGERTIFYDDFTDWAPDEPPPHWKVRGPAVQLRMGGGIHELFMPEGCDPELTSPPIKGTQNFTIELDLMAVGSEVNIDFQNPKGDGYALYGHFGGEETTANIHLNGPGDNLGSGEVHRPPNTLLKFAVWVQQGRVRGYINGERVVDANQVELQPISRIVINHRWKEISIRRIRIAESAPDFSTAIGASGRYVTHGIQFDTDSDRLKVESAPVLKLIASGLIKNPNLKVEIDGYTDSTGDEAHNKDLSKRRAEAVRGVLVSQFGIEPNRLTAAGFGPANPVGSNDTADGRATNRRVEFVKQ